MNTSRLKQVVFAVAAVLGFFLCAEVFLRAAGFRFQRGLSYMQFGYPNPHELHHIFVRDDQLLWRMKPGFDFGEGFEPLNSRGFRGPEFEEKKEDDIFRIVCLGDSVTFGREDASYPAILSEKLSGLHPDPKYEVINLGVPGYSSWQGLKLLSNRVFDLEPDLVVWHFGWNDHWLAQGFPDSEQSVESSFVYEIRDALQYLRTYQALNYLAVKLLPAPRAPAEARKYRVPVEEYERTLALVAETCKEREVPVIFLTAPAGFGLGPLPDFFLILGFIDDEDGLPELHAGYNRVVRETAKGRGVGLVDAELIFESEGAKNFFNDPGKDIIHPNRKGFELMAEAVLREMESRGWVAVPAGGEKEE